jgi:hypothetical protein
MSSGYALCAILRTAGWETPVSPLAVSPSSILASLRWTAGVQIEEKERFGQQSRVGRDCLHIADDGDFGTTPDFARFAGQRRQRSAWSATCRSCCRFLLSPGTCGESYAPPTCSTLLRGSAPQNPAHGLLCKRRKRGRYHLLYLPEIQSGLENQHPLRIYTSSLTVRQPIEQRAQLQ